MIEIIALSALTIVILALISYHGYYVREVNKERKKLINALVSKNAQEMTNHELADKTKIEPVTPKPPDFIPSENLTEEQFDNMIKNEIS